MRIIPNFLFLHNLETNLYRNYSDIYTFGINRVKYRENFGGASILGGSALQVATTSSQTIGPAAAHHLRCLIELITPKVFRT